jgi:RNA polymerase sigma-70 factor, ECF subfamily
LKRSSFATKRSHDRIPGLLCAAVDRVECDFSTVVETHRLQVFRFLLASLRDVDLAETLTQDCFLKAHRNWPAFRGDSSARTWLMRIAINLQKDHWRSRRMQFWRQAHTNGVDPNDASEWLPGNERSPEQRVVTREQVARVWTVVKSLRERPRTLFLLRYVEEMELSEIAQATGLQLGAVKSHLSRAMATVRLELAQIPPGPRPGNCCSALSPSGRDDCQRQRRPAQRREMK